MSNASAPIHPPPIPAHHLQTALFFYTHTPFLSPALIQTPSFRAGLTPILITLGIPAIAFSRDQDLLVKIWQAGRDAMSEEDRKRLIKEKEEDLMDMMDGLKGFKDVRVERVSGSAVPGGSGRSSDPARTERIPPYRPGRLTLSNPKVKPVKSERRHRPINPFKSRSQPRPHPALSARLARSTFKTTGANLESAIDLDDSDEEEEGVVDEGRGGTRSSAVIRPGGISAPRLASTSTSVRSQMTVQSGTIVTFHEPITPSPGSSQSRSQPSQPLVPTPNPFIIASQPPPITLQSIYATQLAAHPETARSKTRPQPVPRTYRSKSYEARFVQPDLEERVEWVSSGLLPPGRRGRWTSGRAKARETAERLGAGVSNVDNISPNNSAPSQPSSSITTHTATPAPNPPSISLNDLPRDAQMKFARILRYEGEEAAREMCSEELRKLRIARWDRAA